MTEGWRLLKRGKHVPGGDNTLSPGTSGHLLGTVSTYLELTDSPLDDFLSIVRVFWYFITRYNKTFIFHTRAKPYLT